jgi:hypothetical protein
MSDPAACKECQAIVEEIRTAPRESRMDPKRRAERRAWSDALHKLMAGTGEGVDQLLARYPFHSQPVESLRMPEYPEGNPRIREAFGKLFEHQARTGHDVIALLGKSSGK